MGKLVSIFHHHISLLQAFVHITLAQLIVVEDVGARLGVETGHITVLTQPLVQQGCLRCYGLLGIENGGQRFVFNSNEIHGFQGDIPRTAYDGRHRLSHEANLMSSHGRLIENAGSEQIWAVLAGDNGHHAVNLLGPMGIYLHDVSVSLGGAYHFHMKGVR